MRPGYKVMYAALMRRLDRWIMDAIVEDETWEQIFARKGLSCEARGN